MTYLCWFYDFGQDEESGDDVEADDAQDAQDAAQKFHEGLWDSADPVEYATVSVRDGDRVRVFESEARYDVSYWAREKLESKKENKS